MTDARRDTGARGERAAAGYLRERGIQILERNARTRYGEIDLIALDGATLVFAEVKTLRAGNAAGPLEALEAIGPAKQRQVRRLARAWLAERARACSLRYEQIRFDAIAICVSADGRRARVEHIPAAF